MYFKYKDSTAVTQNIGAFGFMRSGADNTGIFKVYVYNSGSRLERFSISAAGAISIWNSADTSERLTIAMNTDNYASIYNFDETGSVYKILRLGTNVTTSALLIDGSTGFVGVNVLPSTYEFRVDGEIYATGDITGNSDVRYKDVLGTVPFTWDDYMAITPIRYRSKLKEGSDPTFGFSAQEMMQHWAEPVSYDPATERYGMKYNAIIPINTRAIQTLKTETELLKERIQELENEVAILKQSA
jgi:hypothetical protein